MRFIIPGGSGLIGQVLIPALEEKGHEIWVLTRHPNSARLPGNARAEVWDGKTAQGWAHLLEGAGAIINLAGENLGSALWTEDRLLRIRSSRVNAGKAIVEAITRAKVRPPILLQQSAIGCYGTSLNASFDESAPFGQDILAGICRDWEDSTRGVEELGVRRSILRTGLFLTRNGGVLTRLMLPFQLFAGGPLGSGKQWYSWIHQEDWINAVVFLLENETAQGIYNLTAPEPVTNAEFGRTLARIMRRPYLISVPGFALRLALGKLSTTVLNGQRVLPAHLQASGFQFQFKTLHAALDNLLQA